MSDAYSIDDATPPDVPALDADATPKLSDPKLTESKLGRRSREGTRPEPPPSIQDDAGYEALQPGAAFMDPTGQTRKKPWTVATDEDFETVPEGEHFVDPDGQVRLKPKYEDVNFTANTLYHMALNPKEQRRALERSYPGKVKEQGGSLYVDDDGTLRKPRGFTKAPGSFLTSQAAPVLGSMAGEIAGGLGGSALAPGAGTLAGAIGGGAVGGAVGQGFNDIVLQLAGVYDRGGGEEAGNLAMAGALGGVGTAVGRGVGALLKSPQVLKNALPNAAAKFFGAEPEGTAMAAGLAEKGVLVPPSGWAKESPHLINVAEVFDPAFRTQKPMLQSAAAHYEQEGGQILQDMGVEGLDSLVKPTVAPSTQAAGEALLAKRLEFSVAADAKLQTALASRRAAVETSGVEATAQQKALESAATESRRAAEQLIDLGFRDIERDIEVASKAARAGSNSGDLWWAVGEKLEGVKQGIQERARGMYDTADQLAGEHLPDIAGLPKLATDFLHQLPEGFEGKYPGIVKQIRDLAGEVAETGEVIREPVDPTFGQLHNLRSILRANYNHFDLTPDIKQGVFKYFAHRVDDILQAPGAAPELKAAAKQLREADTFYREQMGPLTDKHIQAVMNGLESGLPADPKLLFDTLVKEGRSDLTRKVAELVGPNLWAGVKSADVQEMLNLSKTLVPDQIDGRAFAKQVLDRHRHGMLEAVHGREASAKLIEQAQNIEMLNGRLDVAVQPGDTVKDVISKARTAAQSAKEAARVDPLKTLERDMKQIEAEHQKELAKFRTTDPLGFIYNPKVGAAEAVEKILGNEDLLLAAAKQFGPDSHEFNMLRQVWAQRLLQGTLTPGERLAKFSAETQQVIFPGATLDQMHVLAKNMDFLMSTRGVQETAKSMAAQAKVEHPWGSIPLGKAVGKVVPGADYAGRQMLSSYYKLVTTLLSRPGLLRYVERGLKGDPAAREAMRQDIQRLMQTGGALGAAGGESLYQGTSP